jgi:hypothetical protein
MKTTRGVCFKPWHSTKVSGQLHALPLQKTIPYTSYVNSAAPGGNQTKFLVSLSFYNSGLLPERHAYSTFVIQAIDLVQRRSVPMKTNFI